MFIQVYNQNLVKNDKVVSEKSKFKYAYVNGLGPRSRIDLDLQHSQTDINSISCLRLPTSGSKASIVSEKLMVFTFSYREA